MLPPNCLGYYRLPLAPNCCKLSLATLNQHSHFRNREKPYLYYDMRKEDFDHGILRLGVTVERETPKQLVYVCIRNGELWVTCNSGTDEHFLSRHAYMGLYSLMRYQYQDADFEPYNWYDFFEEGKKKSKYLEVICDREGLTIALKEKYSPFWKAGQLLFEVPSAGTKMEKITQPILPVVLNTDNKPFGYLLAEPLFAYRHCNHLPMLLPYIGVFNKAGNDIKSFTKVLQVHDELGLSLNEREEELNTIAFEMANVAWLPFRERTPALPEPFLPAAAELQKAELIFAFWRKALPLLQGQNYLRHYYSISRAPISGKPHLHKMSKCVISCAIPVICFSWRDRGMFYELRMKFKVGGKVMDFHHDYMVFFAKSVQDPTCFYLLNSLADVALLSFFYRYAYGISILKSHYNDDFKVFLTELRGRYGFVR